MKEKPAIRRFTWIPADIDDFFQKYHQSYGQYTNLDMTSRLEYVNGLWVSNLWGT